MATPQRKIYDVVIVGGAMHGASLAWWLTQTPGFDGSVLVVERDPTYAQAATSHTNSCIRQQFSTETNIRISQFGAKFIRNFRTFMGGAPEVPALALHDFGYLYLADTPAFAETLRRNQRLQAGLGAGTRHLSAGEIAAAWPFYDLTGIVAGNHNPVDEGYFDGGTMFDWFRRMGRRAGATYLHDTVTGLDVDRGRVSRVHLASGDSVACGIVVNAAGTRGAAVAGMAGIALPVEPRKRYSFVFEAERPLDRALPLTIDPSGVHMRSEGRYYLAGCPPDDDPPVDPGDFAFDHGIWENKVWPAIAARVPAFEAVRVINEWVGHYDYNTADQNAVLGPHPEVRNFILMNGFSGHGLQQAPAVGRGIAEWIAYGAYRSIDLSPFGYARLAEGRLLTEKAVI